jgi:hypothetical protein
MGLDYIRSATGKPWHKRWNQGLNKLKEPSLFDLAIKDGGCTITATLAPNASAKVGDVCIVESKASGLSVTNGLQTIAAITNPRQDVVAAVMSSCGCTLATVKRVGLFGDTVELAFK